MRKPTVSESLYIYFTKEFWSAIQHLLTGLGSSAFIMHVSHFTEKFEIGDTLGIIMLILIGIIPLLIDFIHFHIKNKQAIEVRLNNLRNSINKLHKKENERLTVLTFKRIDNEIKIIDSISDCEYIDLQYLDLFQKKISELESSCLIGILCENNVQQIESVFVRLERVKIKIDQIEERRLTLDSLPNYEYVREVYGRILKKIMKENDQYITLSSLRFWTKQPFLTMDGCEGFIKNNTEELVRHKLIKRIIVIDENLLKSELEIEQIDFSEYKKREIATELVKLDFEKYKSEKIKELKDQRNDLIKLTESFMKYTQFSGGNSYRSNILTVFCCINIEQLFKVTPYLATVMVLPSDYSRLMLVKTSGLIGSADTKAKIEVGYFKLKNALNIIQQNKHDVKLIISLLNSDPSNIIGPKEGSHNDNWNIDAHNFIDTYNQIFSKLEVEGDKVLNSNQIMDTTTIRDRMKIG